MDRLPINQQLEIISKVSGIDLTLSSNDIQEFVEMSLVRNLGLHNRWEIDETYLRKAKRQQSSVGELRIVSVDELYQWHSLLVKVLRSSSLECAKVFCDAPEFTI